MKPALFSIGDKVICNADYHANEEIYLKAKDNGVAYMPKKNQHLTVRRVYFNEKDSSYYLFFEEIENTLQEACFYELNFAPAVSLKQSIEFSKSTINSLEKSFNNGMYAEIVKRNNIGSNKVLSVLPFLKIVAINYKINLRAGRGYRVASYMLKRSVQLN